jgi:hypothetical protein
MNYGLGRKDMNRAIDSSGQKTLTGKNVRTNNYFAVALSCDTAPKMVLSYWNELILSRDAPTSFTIESHCFLFCSAAMRLFSFLNLISLYGIPINNYTAITVRFDCPFFVSEVPT